MIRLIYPKFWQTKNIIAYLLLPLSWLYLFASYLRRITARPIIFPCKVICVGNISIGGTGKTQIVIFLAKLLKAVNIDFIIISKGYGSKLQTALLVEAHHTVADVGDEAVMLLKYGRVIAAKKIQDIGSFIEKIKPKVIIVDDSMQNPNFHKDIVILSVDTNRLFGNEFLIPAGPLRQYPKQAIDEADIVISVGSANINSFPLYKEHPFLYSNDLKNGDNKQGVSVLGVVNLREYANAPKFYGGNSSKQKSIQAQIVPSIDIDKTKNYFAFSGIGNPERFLSTLENYGLQLVGHKNFPDHHQYSAEDLEYLKEQSKKSNSLLITTRKDYVRICDTDLSIICCDVHLLLDNQQLLVDLIYEKII
ncbi:MAG: tetraacyldisaccharide 4'-kinase [Rickettsia endosymbiont of Pseudomimeciton antennatum]|nr:tetraacyldisaccharide 4'-kinase [Rickettsia endosymbiont of Pseudomimeciton antennatum]